MPLWPTGSFACLLVSDRRCRPLNRFAKKNVDPEPLMRYCLKDVLLRSLHHVTKSSGHIPVSESSAGTHRGVTTNISVVTGLFSTLTRASGKVTEDLLRSDLLDALESALCAADENCVCWTRCDSSICATKTDERRSTRRPNDATRIIRKSSTFSNPRTSGWTRNRARRRQRLPTVNPTSTCNRSTSNACSRSSLNSIRTR